MFCTNVCTSPKDLSNDDWQWTTLGLAIFLQAHRMLKNFVNILKFRGPKCCGISYDKIPLHGALDIASTAMASMIQRNVPKKELQRAGLFRDIFLCIRRQETQDVPENLIHAVEAILSCLERSCAIENISTEIKHVLCALENLPSDVVSKRIKILSIFLKEIRKRLVCNGHLLIEPLYDEQTSTVLNFASNFVRDWNETRCQMQPSIRICRFCDKVIDETARQWGTFCCKDSQRVNEIWKAWALEQSISETRKSCKIQNDLTSSVPRGFKDATKETMSGSRSMEKNSTFSLKENGREENPGNTLYRNNEDSPKGTDRRGFRERTEETVERSRNAEKNSTYSYNAGRQKKPTNALSKNNEDFTARNDHRDETKGGREKNPGNALYRNNEDFSARNDYPEETKGGKQKNPGKALYRNNEDFSARNDYPEETKGGRKKNPGKALYRNNEDFPKRNDDREEKEGVDGSRDRSSTYRGPTGEKREKGGGSPYRSNRSRIDDKDASTGLRRSSKTPEWPDAAENEKIEKSGKMKDSHRGRSSKTQDRDEASANEAKTKTRKIDRSDRDPEDSKGKKSSGTVSGENENERIGRARNADDEEKATGRRVRDNYKNEEMAGLSLSKSKEVRERGRKKADALDSERRGVSYIADEEGKVLRSDGKRKGRSATEPEGDDDSKLMKKRKAEREVAAEDKSTLDSETRKKKEAGVAGKKGSTVLDSSRTPDDDYSKINGSRYQRRKTGVWKVRDIEIAPRNSIEYQLSNQYFVGLGWTVLPVTKTMRKIAQYEATMAKPHLDWFKKRRYDGTVYYGDGRTPFLNFLPDGTGKVFYPNGKTAVSVHRPKNRKYDMYTVFSPGGKDSVGIERESQIVAVFDTIGNGVVFDEDGVARLSYNQIGGICTDNPAGPAFAWTWNGDSKKSIVKTVYTEKSTASLEKFLHPLKEKSIKSSGSVKAPMSPSSSRNKEKKVAEQKPVVDEEEEVVVASGSEFVEDSPKETCRLKIICMKLNDHLSFRILNRTNIGLRFLAGTKSIRIELGTVLNLAKEVGSYYVETSAKNDALKCKFEEMLSNPTDPDGSFCDFVKEYKKIKKFAKQRKTIVAKYRT